MKIYKIKPKVNADKVNLILEIIDNDLSLENKIDKFIKHYTDIKLLPNGFEDILTILFEKFNYQVYVPRRGDVNERFDFLVNRKELNAVIELEIPSTAILDAPRNLLDDLAVLINRRKIKKSSIIPLVICWDFPNNRSDYWNVVKDVDKILDIKIKTISLLSIAILYWLRIDLDLLSVDYFLNDDNKKLDNIIQIMEKNNIDITKYNGFFSPYK